MEQINITKEDFVKLNEDDVLFITNPGRMGDEDGIFFVTNDYTLYRVGGWYMGHGDITLEDAEKQFPKWSEAWANCSNEEYEGKYKYIPMGFGNGLCVDNRIYDKYYSYLEKELEKSDAEDIHKFGFIFKHWKIALENMIKDTK